MVINIKFSLCKITAASKLFQRNYYLPLLKPLSPKDALRRKIITGQNVLGNRIEHYIPVLKSYQDKLNEKKRRIKGVPIIKKRLKRNDNNNRYVEAFFDENFENHILLENIINTKSKGNGQYYCYDVPDKKCTLVITYQMEKSIKDGDIIDITMAQRSEKILIKLKNGIRITLPIANFTMDVPLYRGSGWTEEKVEEEHHHGKETMSIAKLFESHDSGVQEWELEMMRMANRRKKRMQGDENEDWKQMLTKCVQHMDWEMFENNTKKIMDQVDEAVIEENIPMKVENMDKTRNVGEKFKNNTDGIIKQLSTMIEIPEIIKNLEYGELCELENISGVRVKIGHQRYCFIPGQMVKTDDNCNIFVPGQTIENENGISIYTPGITINIDNEPTLIPGLIMGEEEKPAMFLPGESTITIDGQLKFESNEDDKPKLKRRSPSNSLSPLLPFHNIKTNLDINDNKIINCRNFDEDSSEEDKLINNTDMDEFKPERQPFDDALLIYEENRRRMEEAEKRRLKERMEEKILKEESKVDSIRMNIRRKLKDVKFETPPPYVPIQPVKKSYKLEQFEERIRDGTFLENDKTKLIMEKARNSTRLFKYQHILNGGYGRPDYGRLRY